MSITGVRTARDHTGGEIIITATDPEIKTFCFEKRSGSAPMNIRHGKSRSMAYSHLHQEWSEAPTARVEVTEQAAKTVPVLSVLSIDASRAENREYEVSPESMHRAMTSDGYLVGVDGRNTCPK